MWEFGPHKVTCASIVSDQVDEMLEGETARVFYSDPPWGEGNLAYWKTMNRRMTGDDTTQVTHEQLYARIGELIQKFVRGYVFIETGLRWVGFATSRLQAHGVKILDEKQFFYKSGNKMLPHALIWGITSGIAERKLELDPKLSGAALSRAIVAEVGAPGEIVLDPCCGMGYTASAAISANMHFRGNELNRARLQKTMAILKRETDV